MKLNELLNKEDSAIEAFLVRHAALKPSVSPKDPLSQIRTAISRFESFLTLHHQYWEDFREELEKSAAPQLVKDHESLKFKTFIEKNVEVEKELSRALPIGDAEAESALSPGEIVTLRRMQAIINHFPDRTAIYNKMVAATSNEYATVGPARACSGGAGGATTAMECALK